MWTIIYSERYRAFFTVSGSLTRGHHILCGTQVYDILRLVENVVFSGVFCVYRGQLGWINLYIWLSKKIALTGRTHLTVLLIRQLCFAWAIPHLCFYLLYYTKLI